MAHALCGDLSWMATDKKAEVMKGESTEGTERKQESFNVSKMCLSCVLQFLFVFVSLSLELSSYLTLSSMTML